MRKITACHSWILWLFAAVIILSGIHAQQSHAALPPSFECGIPLSAKTCRASSGRICRDLPAEGIAGARKARTIIDEIAGGRGRVLFRPPYLLDSPPETAPVPQNIKFLLALPRETGTGGISPIIHYIHDKDGAKGAPFL